MPCDDAVAPILEIEGVPPQRGGETLFIELVTTFVADSQSCAAFGTTTDIALQRKLGAGFFGGEGFILQRLRGDGMAFVHIGGTVVRRELRAGEVLRVDTGCIGAFTASVEYDIERAGNLKSMVFGGEHLCWHCLDVAAITS